MTASASHGIYNSNVVATTPSTANSFSPPSNPPITPSSHSTTGKFDMNDIVMHFGREYYTNMCCHPERLYNFYGKHSSVLHCFEEDMDASVCVGLEEINERIMSMNYGGTRVVIGNIDCQPTMNGGIMIFVLGSMLWNNGKTNKFAQTFILAEQPNGYFVLNDVMRIINGTVASFSASRPTTNETSLTEEKTIAPKALPTTKGPVEVRETTVATKEQEMPRQQPKASTPSKREPTSETKIGITPKSVHIASGTTVSSTADIKPNVEKKSSKATFTESSPIDDKPNSSSWASLAAGQQNRWRSGVVAESKGPIATIAVLQGNSDRGATNRGRVNYRTGNGVNIEPPRHSSKNKGRQEGDLSKDESRVDQNPSQRQLGRSAGSGRDKDRDNRRFEYDAAKSIYISQMKGEVKRDAVKKLFERFGEVKHIECIPSKGIAFIEFAAVNGQREALAGGASLIINDQPVRVEPRRAPNAAVKSGGSAKSAAPTSQS